jgi:hypothetical protein
MPGDQSVSVRKILPPTINSIVPHYGGMIRREFEEQREDALLSQIDDLLRKRLDLVHDLIDVLARGIIRIERHLNHSRPFKSSSADRRRLSAERDAQQLTVCD